MNITREDYQKLLHPQFTPEQQARRAALHASAQHARVNFTPLSAQVEQPARSQGQPRTEQ